MKRLFYFLAIMLIALSGNIQASELKQLYTEEYPPFSVKGEMSNGGVAYNIVEKMLERAGENPEISFGKWDDIYKNAKATPGTGVFVTALTAPRRDDFIWVGPLAEMRYYVYTKPGSKAQVASIRDLQKLKSIAVTKGYAVEKLLRDAGCDNLTIYNDQTEAINAILNMKSQAGVFPMAVLQTRLANMAERPTALNATYPFMTRYLYLALNKSTSATTAFALQRALKSLQDDGTLKKIYRAKLKNIAPPAIGSTPLFPANVETVQIKKIIIVRRPPEKVIVVKSSEPISAVPTVKNNVVERPSIVTRVLISPEEVTTIKLQKVAPITVYAEDFPPLTYRVGDSSYIQGAAAEIITAIQMELGLMPSAIKLTEWNSAYFTAKETPFSAIAAIKKLPEREDLFYWIGPYASDAAWLYARRDSPLNVKNLLEAKTIPSIACVGGAFTGHYFLS